MKFFKKIKENLKDPKKKSLTLLGIYALFFAFVFIVISFGKTVDYNYDDLEKNDDENSSEILNYNYSYKIQNNQDIIEINGVFKDGIDVFNYNGISYIKENNIYYHNNQQVVIDFNFNIDKYKYDKIELLIENSDSQTTYKESNKILYNINVSKYFEILNEDNNCNEIDCTNISIPITVEKDKIINNVLIDLSSYYGHTYTVQIIYSILIYD